jgi:hypothetical protein
MKLEESFLYTHVGDRIYSQIQDIGHGIELVTEAMTAFKDNEIKKLNLHNEAEEKSTTFTKEDMNNYAEEYHKHFSGTTRFPGRVYRFLEEWINQNK